MESEFGVQRRPKASALDLVGVSYHLYLSEIRSISKQKRVTCARLC
jgi:hypothetical protein